MSVTIHLTYRELMKYGEGLASRGVSHAPFPKGQDPSSPKFLGTSYACTRFAGHIYTLVDLRNMQKITYSYKKFYISPVCMTNF